MSPSPGTGEINSNPFLVDPAGRDFSLSPGSPCIDAGNPDPIFDDPDGTRGDMGALYHDQNPAVAWSDREAGTWSGIKALFR